MWMIVDVDMEVSENGGVPQNSWCIMENPNLKWMIWGHPHFRRPPYNVVPPSYKLVYRFISPSKCRYIYDKA
jgi:hypothetical protein